MTITLEGILLTGGPSSINLSDLHDVSIATPMTGQYLRYNSSIDEWQNAYINSDVYLYLSGSLSGSNGISLTKLSGPSTIDISLSVSATGDASGTIVAGNLPLTLATVNSDVGTFGDATDIPIITVNAKGLITSISTVPLVTVGSAGTVSGGSTGAILYQSAPGTTAFLPALSSTQVLVSGVTPSWTNTPSLTGTNFTGIPNTGLTNSSLTIGSTSISLGSTATTLAGLTSVTSTTFVGSLSGNASTSSSSSTASTLATARNITATGDASWTVTFDGSGNVSAALALATVNSSPVTASFQKITVNGKGLTTATSAVVSSDIISSLGYTPVNVAGDTMLGNLILNADPTTALGAATKQYVDNASSGLSAQPACVTSSTAALPACTYNNGSSGLGATLTANSNGALGTVGGYSPSVSDRILIKDQVSQLQNGIYVVTSLGSVGSTWVLTRASNFDGVPAGEVASGDFTYVQNGTLAGTQWVLSVTGSITIGTTSLVFTQLSGAGTYTSGTGISIASNVISNIGVTSAVAGSNISVSSATGAVTISVSGTVPTSTNLASGSAGSVPYQSAAGTTTFLSAGTSSQVLVSGASPTWTNTPTLTGTNFTGIPNSALSNNSITVSPGTGIGVSGSPVSLGGTVTVSNTGVTSLSGTSNQISVSSATGSSTIYIPNMFLTPKFSGGSTESITAAGITQGTATVINAQYSYVNGGTGGVVLPASPVIGQVHWIDNNTGVSITVYPTAGASYTFDGAAPNVGITLLNGESLGVVLDTGGVNWSTFEDAIAPGTGISLAYTAGTRTITNTGVTSIVAGTNISISGATGAVTINSTGASSSTNLSGGTTGAVPYQSAASTTAFLSAVESGNVLTAAGTLTAPAWSAPIFKPKPMDVVIQSSTAYNYGSSLHHSQIWSMTSSSPVTITIQPDSYWSGSQLYWENGFAPSTPGPMPSGGSTLFANNGTGGLTFAAGSGVTIYTPSSLVVTNSNAMVTLVKYSANTWAIEGHIG